MKKIIITLLFCTAFLFASATMAFAEDAISESPNVKIVIDGKIGTYDAVPIVVNDRTMLPFRAVLSNLGVQNDDILWDSENQEITVIKDSIKIKLKVNDTTAYVNGAAQNLDVAPILYKDKTYIPARFIAQTLGKKVVWDGSYNAVLIRDAEEFDKVKEILQKSDAAMEPITKTKLAINMDTTIDVNGTPANMTTTSDAEVDMQKKLMHMVANVKIPAANTTQKVDEYITSGAVYMQSAALGNKWQKIELVGDIYKNMFDKNNAFNAYYKMQANDSLCAGLIIDKTSDGNILLKGDVYLADLLNNDSMKSAIPQAADLKIGINKCYMEMTLDKDTYLVSKAYMDIDMTVGMANMSQNMKAKYNYQYDYKTPFEIALPEEAKQAEAINLGK